MMTSQFLFQKSTTPLDNKMKEIGCYFLSRIFPTNNYNS